MHNNEAPSMEGAPAPAPMDGASDVPPMPEGPMGPTGPQGDPAGVPMSDPSMDGMNDGNGQLDPQMNAEPPMDNGEMGGEEGGADDSTVSIINQLSPEDREAVRSYAESMLSRDETENGMSEEPAPAEQGGEQPMMESVVFTKGQLKKIHESLNKNNEKENNGNKKMKKPTAKSSPFKSPKFD